jgi:hypothetical protein
MSTKIYDAYRIKKENDILVTLKKAKELVIQEVANDKLLLTTVHAISIAYALKEFEQNKENLSAKNAIDEHKKGKLDGFWLQRSLEKNSHSLVRGDIDVDFYAMIFYDDDYWYLKFFYNTNSFSKYLEKISTELNLEDFHYQNQVDPPNDVPAEEFDNRSEKWDELLADGDDTYINGLRFDFFNAHEFRKLISKYYYTGEKDLYKHLAYKFDQKFVK